MQLVSRNGLVWLGGDQSAKAELFLNCSHGVAHLFDCGLNVRWPDAPMLGPMPDIIVADAATRGLYGLGKGHF